MRELEGLLRVRVGQTKRLPAHSRGHKSIHAPDFDQIEETNRHAVVNWRKLPLPHRFGPVPALFGSKLVAAQPAPDSPAGDSGEALSFWYSVNASLEKCG